METSLIARPGAGARGAAAHDEPARSVYVDIFMGALPEDSLSTARRRGTPRHTGYEREHLFPRLHNPRGGEERFVAELTRASLVGLGGATGSIAGKALATAGVEPLRAKAIAYGLVLAASHPVGTATCVGGTAVALGRPLVRAARDGEFLLAAEHRADCAVWARTIASHGDRSTAGASLAATGVCFPEGMSRPATAATAAPLQVPTLQTMTRAEPISRPAGSVVEHVGESIADCCLRTCEALGTGLDRTGTYVVAPACVGCTTSLTMYGLLRFATVMARKCTAAMRAPRERIDSPV